jgi:hypothetical protein
LANNVLHLLEKPELLESCGTACREQLLLPQVQQTNAASGLARQISAGTGNED